VPFRLTRRDDATIDMKLQPESSTQQIGDTGLTATWLWTERKLELPVICIDARSATRPSIRAR